MERERSYFEEQHLYLDCFDSSSVNLGCAETRGGQDIVIIETDVSNGGKSKVGFAQIRP